MYKVVFKSCKYNHSPDYMSSLDGSEGPTDKLLSEGDKELTHMCFRVDGSEAYTILEERHNGVAIGAVVAYYNRLLKKFIAESEDLEDNFVIWSSIIPFDDFLTALGKTNRIVSAEIFVEKKVIGTDYLNLMDDDASSQDDLIITVKVKPRHSLTKRTIENAFNAITSGGTEMGRICVRGKDLNKMSVTIDSLNGKKVAEVTVNLLESGVADSYSLFARGTLWSYRMKQRSFCLSNLIYTEWLRPIFHYYVAIKKNEAAFEIVLPGVIAITSLFLYSKAEKLKQHLAQCQS